MLHFTGLDGRNGKGRAGQQADGFIRDNCITCSTLFSSMCAPLPKCHAMPCLKRTDSVSSIQQALSSLFETQSCEARSSISRVGLV